MLWLLGGLSGPPESDSRRKLVLAACDCAELALKHVPEGEDRPRKAINTARRWARQEDGVNLDEVRGAADAAAAYAAAYAAYAAADATYATDAAAYAAYTADADADAAYAAYAAADAAWAADAAAYAAYAADAARTHTHARCADIVRRHYPAPPEIT